MGQSFFYFFYKEKYNLILLSPNKTTTLNFAHIDCNNYNVKFEGEFEQVFRQSEAYAELIKNALFGYKSPKDRNPLSKKSRFQSANDFRDSKLREFDDRIAFAVEKMKPLTVSRSLQNKLSMFMKADLINKYDSLVVRYNREIVVDSLLDSPVSPERDISYYQNLLKLNNSEDDILMFFDPTFLQAIRKDSVLDLPNLINNPADSFISRLRKLLPGQNDLFYEVILIGAYVDQINQKIPLSENQKTIVNSYFKNAQISNYIHYRNALVSDFSKKSFGRYYLPYDTAKNDVLNDLLLKYKGKVVIADFWATWCGPCIDAFNKIKEVKAQYTSSDDVVFVYLTDQSSDRSRWEGYADIIAGEHYYLSKTQMNAIYTEYNIESIPSYLLFDKNGSLAHKNIGGYMGNEKLIKWIGSTIK
ncbi:hypothetical protein GCM10017764_13710 [Sphingobacterium griseoflavum]|uniref:Thioredoxin domain-containing protein n=1 Tax=Sphingobacterium griseoflavum TaxID=1474952 RepID=A0ABQ3HYG4_9SPHI|nr:hypothetical protein GCM10017764_13710 [Sphingobacterium griseoflavum]